MKCLPVCALLLFTAPGLSQEMPVARLLPSGDFELWSVQEPTGASTLAFQDVGFLTVGLSGYANKDRLRADLPAAFGVGEPAEGIRLPDGGRLHRISRGGATEILHVHPDGTLGIAFSRPAAAGQASLLPSLSVSRDGTLALLATTPQAGGEVHLLDLSGTLPPRLVTSAGASLDVDDASLRVSATSAWFVAGNALYCADLSVPGAAAPVTLPIAPEDTVLGELALAAGGDHVAVVTSDDDDLYRIHLVPRAGQAVTVTSTPGNYRTPSYDNPLGPWLEVSPSGDRVAYVFEDENLDTEELFVQLVSSGTAAEHVTAAPDFPAYLDNIGPLVFVLDVALCFFAGDTQLSQTSEELIGAGEMYVADFSGPLVTYRNVSMTNGQLTPPFTQPGTLSFTEAVVDPLVTMFILSGETEDDGNNLSCFALTGQPSTKLLLSPIEETPELIRAGTQVLVSSVDEASGNQELHLLSPEGSSLPELVELMSVPGSHVLDRFAVGPKGQRAAFVATDGSGRETPYTVLLSSAKTAPVLGLGVLGAPPPAIGSTLGISWGAKLYLGAGSASGPFKLWRMNLPRTANAGKPTLSAGSGSAVQVPMGADLVPLLR